MRGSIIFNGEVVHFLSSLFFPPPFLPFLFLLFPLLLPSFFFSYLLFSFCAVLPPSHFIHSPFANTRSYHLCFAQSPRILCGLTLFHLYAVPSQIRSPMPITCAVPSIFMQSHHLSFIRSPVANTQPFHLRSPLAFHAVPPPFTYAVPSLNARFYHI